eukprot:TRINITY_DN130_c0_g1_i4.p1 TRINITY_DN130_c0_g1~~TRINITY_DN130_c0_g1_i4.p1  ORF type:complete len:842 (-),score=153.05 TRINITY_DN130_c0_g1_i4:63-2588(-)
MPRAAHAIRPGIRQPDGQQARGGRAGQRQMPAAQQQKPGLVTRGVPAAAVVAPSPSQEAPQQIAPGSSPPFRSLGEGAAAESRSERQQLVSLVQLPAWQTEPDQPESLEEYMRHCRTQKCVDFQAGSCNLHKPMVCFNFHFEGQRRRSPMGPDGIIQYWDTPCKWMSHPAKCPRGDSCKLAHSKGEIAFHPAKYKTRVCNGEDCRKSTCCFAHSVQELRPWAEERYSQLALLTAQAEKKTEAEEPAGTEQEEEEEEVVDMGTEEDMHKEVLDGKQTLPTSCFDEPSMARPCKPPGPSAVDLKTFKVFPCRKGRGVSHDPKVCAFFHNPRDRRRPLGIYSPEPCDQCFDSEVKQQSSSSSSSVASKSSCSRGDACQLCHNRLELLYHEQVFKRRFCATFPEVSSCQRGALCAFAHSRDEVRVELLDPEEEQLVARWSAASISESEGSSPPPELVDFFTRRFKTLWCPYGVQHGWHECPYAHTYQDWRRNPDHGYGSEPCVEWSRSVGERIRYAERCSKSLQCPLAHGSKEQLYHPLYYKTMPCTDFAAAGSCPRGGQCAFFHGVAEQRPMPEAQQTAAVAAAAAKGWNHQAPATPTAATATPPGHSAHEAAAAALPAAATLPPPAAASAAAVAAAARAESAAAAATSQGSSGQLSYALALRAAASALASGEAAWVLPRGFSAMEQPARGVGGGGASSTAPRVRSVQDVEASLSSAAAFAAAAAASGYVASAAAAPRIDDCTYSSSRPEKATPSVGDCATTLDMRTSWGSFGSLVSLASSNSASANSPPPRVAMSDLEPAYVRLRRPSHAQLAASSSQGVVEAAPTRSGEARGSSGIGGVFRL